MYDSYNCVIHCVGILLVKQLYSKPRSIKHITTKHYSVYTVDLNLNVPYRCYSVAAQYL